MSILASTSSASTAAGWGGMIIWLVVLFGFMYFFMIRPQQKEAKKKNAMLSELAVGDTVLTTSGFYGTVIDIADDTVIVEFGNNKNCRIPMQKAAISAVEKPEEAMEKYILLPDRKVLEGQKMKLNTVGIALSYYREKYGLSMTQVCEGICSPATMFRIEEGYHEVDSLVSATLLSRIGKQVLEFELLLNEKDYNLFRLRKDIHRNLEEKNLDTAEKLLQSYQSVMPKKQVLHEQYYLWGKAELLQKRGASKEEIKAVLNEAILLTKPFFGKKKNTSDLYSEMEIKLFLGLIQFSEDISWKEAELKRMLLFTRKYDSKKIKEQAEMSILKELASIQEEKGDAQKELEYIEQALTLVKESRTMRGLAELHFKKAGLLKELMQRNKDMQQEYQKQCQVELTMAYYTALVMNNVELVQKIKTTGDRV